MHIAFLAAYPFLFLFAGIFIDSHQGLLDNHNPAGTGTGAALPREEEGNTPGAAGN